MKDKQLLKLLKREVDSMIPNCLDAVKKANVTVEPAKAKNIKVTNEQFNKHKKWVGVLASCVMIVVAVIGISIPIALSKNNRQGTSLGSENSVPSQNEELHENQDELEDN